MYILISFSYNYFYLYCRNKKIFRKRNRWIFPSCYFLLGMVLTLFLVKGDKDGKIIKLWVFLTPLLFTFFLFLGSKLSLLIYKRDFRLWLRFSDEVSYYHTRSFSFLDKLISIIALFMSILLPFLFVVILKM